MGKIKDITNQRFGNLIAIKNTGKKDNGRNLIWLCQCDCGNYCEVSGNNLRTGHTKSCGCLRQIKCQEVGKQQQIINEIGNKYYKLTVVSLYGIKNHYALWRCKCECGNEVIVAGSHLRSGHTKSCGCLKSTGEMLINQILTDNQINFITQYTIHYNNSFYKFDYAIFNDNDELIKLIEFDGEQHYPEFNNQYYNYELTHSRDIIKNQYCKENNIVLNRIPYWEKDNLTLDLILGDKYQIEH